MTMNGKGWRVKVYRDQFERLLTSDEDPRFIDRQLIRDLLIATNKLPHDDDQRHLENDLLDLLFMVTHLPTIGDDVRDLTASA